MTPEVEKKRREVFEAWLSKMIGSRYVPGLDNRRDETGVYVYAQAASYWTGFNAALDAVEIDLSELNDLRHHGEFRRGLWHAVLQIEATGLGLRVK